MPKVSFILPAYKRQFLHEAIDSILSQTYNDFELIIVDDDSPEKLKEVIDEFHDKRISYHHNEQNIGGKNLVTAWNHAMQYATAEWCVLASDDDIYAPDFLETMMNLVEKYPKVDIFHCRICEINEDGEVVRYGEFRNEYETIWEMLYYRGVKRTMQCAPDFMFKRKALNNINGFIDFPSAFYSDDATWYTLAKDNGIVCSSKCLFKWRMSNINTCGRKDNLYSKSKAILDFNIWLKKFISLIYLPTTQEDSIFKSLVEKYIYTANENLLHFTLDQANYSDWKKIIVELKDMPALLQKKCKRKRLEKIISFYNYYLLRLLNIFIFK